MNGRAPAEVVDATAGYDWPLPHHGSSRAHHAGGRADAAARSPDKVDFVSFRPVWEAGEDVISGGMSMVMVWRSFARYI